MAIPIYEGEATYDVTFENVQAGLRTTNTWAIVLGTGDLSELCWAGARSAWATR